VSPSDLARAQFVVVGDIGLGIAGTMLELDRQSKLELLAFEGGARPIDPDRLADPACLFTRERAIRP
jgi:hypothetical protein